MAVHGRGVELRQHRKPREAERHNGLLMGEELRSLDDDVLRVDRIAHALIVEEVDRWATEHRIFEWLDRLRRTSTRPQVRTSVRPRAVYVRNKFRRAGPGRGAAVRAYPSGHHGGRNRCTMNDNEGTIP